MGNVHSAAAAMEPSNGYGRYAVWAIANEHVRQTRYDAAEAALAGAV